MNYIVAAIAGTVLGFAVFLVWAIVDGRDDE